MFMVRAGSFLCSFEIVPDYENALDTQVSETLLFMFEGNYKTDKMSPLYILLIKSLKGKSSTHVQ